jgi:pyruvate/2-oxoglutarate dehydrogenase complex dihydrolipoamide dehydrogenase (E3) component
MARHTHDVIIVGGGAAGLVTTVGCSRLGMKTALLERKALGGDCLYHGCVPSKTLLRSATVYKEAQRAPDYGLPEMQMSPIDMKAVNARVQRVVEHIAQHDSPERFRGLGAELYFGESRFRSPHEIEVPGGEIISAPKIVLATGSSPKAPPISGLDETGYITNLDVFDLTNLPKRLLVIGAGPIGAEMSQAFARLGSSVTLLDVANQVLPREDADMAAYVRRQLEADGVTVRVGVKPARAEAAGGEKRIHLEDGEVLAGEELLVAAGRVGNTEGLELDAAGVEIKGGFIATDSKLRSSQKHIHAIGDCNGRYLFTHVASAEASVVVRRVALRVGGAMNYNNVPWVTYTEPELASIGYNEQRATEAGLEYSVLRTQVAGNDRAQAEGKIDGEMKMLLDPKERVIGVQIAAAHAGDLLLPQLYAVSENWKVGKLMGPIVPYPTMGELHKKAAGDHMGPKLFNDRIRGILRRLYRYRGTGS